ncbi:c-type cytochrome [Emcibacter sp. SYSU 3D8]|uniref:c-type cytochrome n=1 Tax=Emcibacter sp. SYSU 3D8 TaxID=3133969 RepID=UPI0031FE5EA1
MRRRFLNARFAGRVAALTLGSAVLSVPATAEGPSTAVPAAACAADPGGITVPPGFCATIFADNMGHVRHLAVAPDGVVYANTWSGTYYGKDQPKTGGFVVAMRDSDGDGKADVVRRFGETPESGGAGGTGIAFHDNAVFVEESDRILRYAIPQGMMAPDAAPEIVVSGLPLDGDHPMHPFAIDGSGGLYVDLGSASNACQSENRAAGARGARPCVELETRGGIWRYESAKTGQTFSKAERFATGIRNAVGIAADATGVYATQHGRDQLFENWPKLYTQEQGANQPAEVLLKLQRGADFGWPECYHDGEQGNLVLAPEYGGDGGKAVGPCADKQPPVAAFPAHWAPNGLAFYHGAMFPHAYAGGAFIAFHGSWNRAPRPQGGYNVVFQPLSKGKATGPFVVFADGFAGAVKEPGQARYRPSGVAVGPDGALYIGEDTRGRIWRVTFQGDRSAATLERAPEPAPIAVEMTAAADLPVPEGFTSDQIVLGRDVYLAQSCSGCHASNGKGTPFGPDLTSGTWLWGDGSVAAISEAIRDGIPAPKEYKSVMPPLGGGALSEAELAAIAAYVWALGNDGAQQGR